MSEPWPMVPLGEVLTHRKQFIEIDDLQRYNRCRVQLHTKGIVIRDAVNGAEIKTKKQQVCQANEFLVAEIDAKVGGFGIVPPDLAGAVVSSHYFLYQIDCTKLNHRFLGFYIRTPYFRDQVTAQGSTNYAAIRPHDVLRYTCPLPPLQEQRAIVARIETLAAKIETARRLRAEATSEGQSLYPSALGEFFRELSQHHRVESLGSLCTQITDGPHKTPVYMPEGVPFVTVRNMVTGQLDFTQLNFITPEDHAEFTKRCKPEQGDILYSKDGATRGRPCYIDTDREFSIFVSVALIKPDRHRLDGRYLCHLLNSSWIKDCMTKQSRGDMIPHIVLGEIRHFPVPLQSLDDQRKTVTYLDNIQSKIRSLCRLQMDSEADLSSMLPSILDQAFKGELSRAER